MMSLIGSLKRQRGQRGIALVEVLVAVMILSVSSVYVLQALARAAVLEREIRNLGSVQAFASGQLAEFEALAHQGKTLKKKYAGNFTESEQSFQWRAVIKPSTDVAEARRVELHVTWKQGAEPYQRRFEGLFPAAIQKEELL